MEISKNERDALKYYQETTSMTAIYPEQHAVSYLMLGLLNEIAEFVNAENSKTATSELGDMFWFISELSNLIGSDLVILLCTPIEGWTPPIADTFAAAYLAGELAETAGAVAKHLRDGSPYHDEMLMFLHKAIFTVYSIVDIMSGSISPDNPDLAFAQILENNRAKLIDRQQRGVLGGSGNKR